MAIKVIKADNLINLDSSQISFQVIHNNVLIFNDSDDLIESIFIEVSIEDWMEISKFIKSEIGKIQSNG